MSDKVQAPVLKKKKNLSPVWILPVLAAVLGLWLLVNYIQERGHDVVVQFPSATGIEANKTFVRYQGIIVGQVTKVRLAKDNVSVDVSIRMQNSVDDLLKKNTQFWVVSPKASLTGIDGLDALFSGNYIAMAPGDGKPTYKFIGAVKAPSVIEHRDGLFIHINAPQRGSLDIGSGLYFQQVKVGEIVDFKLNKDGSGVVFDAHVEPDYQFLVRKDSRFWNISGVQAEVNRSGLNVNLNSLATMIAGGISFSSPKSSGPAKDTHRFDLYDNEQQASPRIAITLTAANSDGLSEGSAIRYRGIEIGEIDKVALIDDKVVLAGWIEASYQHLIRQQSQFSRVGASIGLEGVAHLDTLIFGEFIRLWPGAGELRTEFTLLESAPINADIGRRFVLTQQSLDGVSIGAPVRYRGLAVGEVLDVELSSDGVDIEVLVAKEHQHLVRENSRFWVQSAVEVNADFSKLKVTAQPLTNVMSGGIAFSSSTKRPEAAANSRFSLASDRDSALGGKPLQLTLHADTLAGLNVGAPVLYRDLETGTISDIALDGDDNLQVTLSIASQYRHLINSNTRFWHYSGVEIEGSLAGVKVRSNPIISMIRGGISLGHIDNTLASAPFNDHQIYAEQQQALATGKMISLSLSADALINTNAPIRYLGHQIGEVRSVKLDQSLSQQTIVAELDSAWAAKFSRSDTRFYLVRPKVSLSGIRHVETILKGNHIAALPGSSDLAQTKFIVATEEPVLPAFGDGLRLILTQSKLGSLHIGSPILYRQIRVGEVIDTRLTASGDSVEIEIQLKERYQHLVNQSTKFWNASGVDIDFGVFTGADIKTESLETLLAGGIAFATKEATTPLNQLSDNQVLDLHQKVKPSWLSWRPVFTENRR